MAEVSRAGSGAPRKTILQPAARAGGGGGGGAVILHPAPPSAPPRAHGEGIVHVLRLHHQLGPLHQRGRHRLELGVRGLGLRRLHAILQQPSMPIQRNAPGGTGPARREPARPGPPALPAAAAPAAPAALPPPCCRRLPGTAARCSAPREPPARSARPPACCARRKQGLQRSRSKPVRSIWPSRRSGRRWRHRPCGGGSCAQWMCSANSRRGTWQRLGMGHHGNGPTKQSAMELRRLAAATFDGHRAWAA